VPNHDDRHLDANDLNDLLARTLSSDASRRVIGHLLGGCDACRERVREGLLSKRAALTAASEAATDAAFDAVLDRSGAFIGRHLADLEAGALLWAELRVQPAGRRLTLVRNSRRFCTAGVLRALLRDYQEGLWREPAEGLAIAELGMAIADRLDAAPYRASWLADLLGEALAVGGNAQRLAGRSREAGKLLHQAARWLSVGSGDLLAEAQLLTYQGSRWQALGRFEKAGRAFGRAEQAYRQVGEVHLAARSLVARAEAIGNLHPEQGIRLIRRAIPDIDAARDPHLELAAHHNLAWYLNDAGQGWEAREEVGRSAGLYQRFSGDALASLSRAWLRGRIDRSLNELEQARRWYERAWAGFEELGMESHLAVLSIDRAELQAAAGDFASAGWLLARTLVLLKGWGAGQEALAVLRLLRETVASGQCERATFRRASLVVRRAWGRAEAVAGGEAS
jgi:tetratricopeptide (TPR) repeat protein